MPRVMPSAVMCSGKVPEPAVREHADIYFGPGLSGVLPRHRLGADLWARAGLLHSRLPGIALAALFPGRTRSGLPDFQASTRACNRLCNPWDRRMDDRVGRAASRTRIDLDWSTLILKVRSAGCLPS